MESENLTPPSSDDESFDRWLRAESALPRIPDEGFSAALAAKLPVPGQTRLSPRTILCLFAATVGAGVAASSIAVAPGVSIDLEGVQNGLVRIVAGLGNPAAGAAAGAMLFSLGYVFRPELRRWRRRYMGL